MSVQSVANSVKPIFVPFGSVSSLVCLAFRFVHGSVTGEGISWGTKLARTYVNCMRAVATVAKSS